MSEKGLYEFGPFRLDPQLRVLFRDEAIVPLTPKVVDTLIVLVKNAGNIVPKDELLAAVWNGMAVEEGNLTHNVSVLRKTLRNGSGEPPYIETVPKRGYRFTATVTFTNGNSSSVAASSPPPVVGRKRWIWVTAGAAVLASVGIIFWPRPAQVSPSEFEQLTNFSDSAVAPALSPDGKLLAFIRSEKSFLSPGQIYVKALPDGESVQLTNESRPKFSPQFSSDGARLVYSSTEPARVAWDTWSVSLPGGAPKPMLTNASGLTWISDRQILFSEVRTGMHMGIVTANEDRSGRRVIYFPAHERAMAHYSYLSADRKWVLVVEMDRTAAWQPCRLVPFDGSSAGRQVGPDGACTSAGWSPDGRWMYFSVFVGGASHIWRQRFSGGPPEQLTVGPTEEEGIAIAADGRSLITSVGMRQTAVWLHDQDGERPVLKEGFASLPRFSGDGSRLYAILRKDSTNPLRELTVTDMGSSKTEPLLPGVSMERYDISPDENEVVFTTAGKSGSPPELWTAPLNSRTPPSRVPSSGDTPHFGPANDLLFVAVEQNRNFLYRMNKDGSARRKVIPHSINNFQNMSADRRWAVVFAPIPLGDTGTQVQALPVDRGRPVSICPGFCVARWSPDGGTFYVSFQQGKTLAIPLAKNNSLPPLPDTGIRSAEDVRLFPGAIVFDQGPGPELAPGVDIHSYAYVKRTMHRNLFRIPLR